MTLTSNFSADVHLRPLTRRQFLFLSMKDKTPGLLKDDCDDFVNNVHPRELLPTVEDLESFQVVLALFSRSNPLSSPDLTIPAVR